MGPIPSFLQGKHGQEEQESRKQYARPLEGWASPTAKPENIASWERRYPNLATYLALGKLMIQAVTCLAAIGIIVLTIKEFRVETGPPAVTDMRVPQVETESVTTFEPLLYGVAAEISLAIFYIANMASIEFVKVICSIEQESVLARLDRENRR